MFTTARKVHWRIGWLMSKNNLEFMSSLSSAIIQRNSRSSRVILNVIILSVLSLIVWASFGSIDEIVKGYGKVVPSSKVQIIQNLEGGIVSEILVKSADIVKQGTPLLKIVNKQFESSFVSSGLKLDELRIRAKRLEIEAQFGGEFVIEDQRLVEQNEELIKNETILFNSHMKFLANQVDMIKEQIKQNESKTSEYVKTTALLKTKKKLLLEEINLVEPLVKKGIESQLTLIRLQKENVNISMDQERIVLAKENSESQRIELLQKIEDLKISFKNRAQKQLNELIARISQITNEQSKFEDQVSRTLVTSPVNGKVKRVLVNTIGGVIKPGESLVEIVPLEDELIIESKIKPEDIAFLYPGQKAIIKFTAYDFSVHGGLEAQLTGISADTIEDKRGNSYYLVELKTTNKFHDNQNNAMKILPGMTIAVDILTGKKTIMEYILKPLLDVKNTAL